MTNKEIARYINKLGKIMELHDENPFKIRSYYSAYNVLRKIEKPLAEMSEDELSSIPGVGKAISSKILELNATGKLTTFEKYADITPDGIIEMLGVRGFGPKKIKVVWRELGIESIGELLYACNENRLISLKGFGAKTQESLKNQLQYFIDSQGKYLYGYIEDEALSLLHNLKKQFPNHKHEITGGLKQKNPIVPGIEIISTIKSDDLTTDILKDLQLEINEEQYYFGEYPVYLYFTKSEDFVWDSFIQSSSEGFIDAFQGQPGSYIDEKSLFDAHDLPYIIPELREDPFIIDIAENGDLPNVIDYLDLKGVIHSHSTYSDGVHSLKEMSEHSILLGLQYLVNSDHSKAAFYANGLTEDIVLKQFEEIDELNSKNHNFRIFKGIEADILSDGSMDYGNDFLKNFEVVIASIHSNLKMDEDKANRRLIAAIENPHTHILGHPTGRLLLSREGYPIDHMKIIDACAANNMVIELNANPLRLDLDWTWIGYALEREVMISINPDSHSKHQIEFMKFGVNVARKAGLTQDMCLNAMDLSQFQNWIDSLN